MSEEKKNQIMFRVTDAEKADLKRKTKQAKMTQQEFLCRTVAGKEVIQLEGIEKLIYEMKKQGTNLNQLAKYANANGGVDQELYNSTLKEVVEGWRLLRLWLDTHR